MVLDTALLNTQHYKVRFKGKVEQSRERSSALHYGVVAIEKGAFGWLSTTVTNNFIDRTLTGTTTLCQGGPQDNSIKGILHIPQSFLTGVSPSDTV